MEIRSRAPLRIGMAGGGTDLASYSDLYGGAVLNITIGMYAYCSIIPTNDNMIRFTAYDNGHNLETPSVSELPIQEDNNLILHRCVYNRIVKDYNHGKPLSFNMITSNDVPTGSGLGSSAVMVVAMIEAYNKWLNLNLDKKAKADLAVTIEKYDLKISEGKQDPYASVYGGLNLMEFKKDGTTIVNSLRIEKDILAELESSTLLYYSGKSRRSTIVLESQIQNLKQKDKQSVEAMHKLKECAYEMKDAILLKDFDKYAQIMRDAWETKKKTSSIVSNKDLEEIINFATANGAEAIKVSGAGGGGFLMLYCNPKNRHKLIQAMRTLPGQLYAATFPDNCAESWIIDN